MALHFYSLKRQTPAGVDRSTLELSTDQPESLRIVGSLLHSARIMPASVEDARALAKWFEGWAKRHELVAALDEIE